jgi:hypothetical protein
MRFVSTRLLGSILLLSVGVAACEEAAIGARCENVYDCDRTGSGSARGCYSYANPSVACPPGSGNSCVCCPVLAMRTNLASLPAACMPRGAMMTDVPTGDAVVMDSASDAAASSDAGADAADAPSTPTDVPTVRDVPNAQDVRDGADAADANDSGLLNDVPTALVDVPDAPVDAP